MLREPECSSRASLVFWGFGCFRVRSQDFGKTCWCIIIRAFWGSGARLSAGEVSGP